MKILARSRQGVNPMSEYRETVPATLMRPYELLKGLGYNSTRISEIISHISLYGTSEGCPEFRCENERRMVEDLIPVAPYEIWDHYEDWRYGIK